uniref:UBA domain-containing protein n=1 Tax=Meloidogyne floridensis TaxID=298350 RepID=A0A915NHE3_9BILA
MNAITGGGGSQASKLTSSALATASLQKQPQLQNNAISAFLSGNKSLIPSAVIIEDEEVIGNRSNSGRFLEREEIREIASNGTITSFNGFTPEQRKLLAAAVLNGELDPEQAVRLLTSENITTANETISELNRTNIDNSLFDYEEQRQQTFFGTKQKQNQHLINAESKLIEWIQQNRPRHSSENLNEVINKNVTTSSSPLTSPPSHDWNNNNFVASERLPYYGKYCGSFVEQTDSAASHNIAGALWAVDERRLLITKFNFIPLSKSENVTFWGGPAKPTGNTALDLFPSENGFIVEAIPIELNIFNGKIIEIEAKISSNTLQSETLDKNKNGSEKVSEIKNKKQNFNLLAEREEDEEEDEKIIVTANITSNSTKRDRRNLYNEIFDNITEEDNDNFTRLVSYDTQQDDIEFKENKLEEKIILNNFTILPVNLEAKNRSFENESFASSFIKNDNVASPNEEKIIRNLKSTQYQQTLLLTLPPERLTKLLDWLAVWEHEENKEALAVVLIP